MVQKTRNYEMFNFLKYNREVKSYERVLNSIKKKNLLEFRPILVDKDFNVLDGQHRLLAAKELELEIYYEIKDKHCTPEDVILLNNQTKWCLSDYLNFWSEQENADYIKLKKLCSDFDMYPTMGYKLLTGNSAGGSCYKLFREGRFVFPDQETESIFHIRFSQIQEILNKIRHLYIGNKAFLNSTKISLTLINLLSNRQVDFNLFFNKIILRMDLIRPCATQEQYLVMFTAIYNYKNQNRIEL